MKRKKKRHAQAPNPNAAKFFDLPQPEDKEKLARVPKPPTSFVTRLKQNKQHLVILALVDQRGATGLTRNEVTTITGFNSNAVNARLDELTRAGILTNTYKRECEISKNKITAYRRP